MPVTPQVLTLNPLNGAAKVDEIDYSADFDNLFSKMEDFDKFFKTGKISYNMLKYMPGLAKAAYQGQLKSTETKRKYGDDSNMETIQSNLTYNLLQISIQILIMFTSVSV